jgi:hypothetical protein
MVLFLLSIVLIIGLMVYTVDFITYLILMIFNTKTEDLLKMILGIIVFIVIFNLL